VAFATPRPGVRLPPAPLLKKEKKMSERIRILIVDDESEIRSILGLLLARENYETAEADDGSTAKEMIEKQDFDLIISDIRMPIMNGIELFRWNKANKNIPTILITGFSELLETQEAFEIGVKEFLAKPFHKEEILNAVRSALNIKKKPVRDPNCFCEGMKKFDVNECVDNNTFKCDIYLKLSEEKFLRIARAGDSVPNDKFKQEDFAAYGAVVLFKKK
jgi:DNA-binding response OmpR family regulator